MSGMRVLLHFLSESLFPYLSWAGRRGGRERKLHAIRNLGSQTGKASGKEDNGTEAADCLKAAKNSTRSK